MDVTSEDRTDDAATDAVSANGTSAAPGLAARGEEGGGLRHHLLAAGLAAVLGFAGIAHFRQPEFFDPIVPDWMPGAPRTTTYVSGAVELAAAALVAVPRTRRFGGWFAAATFVAVFPANVQAALDGGMAELDPPMNSPAAAWLRLPLQLPLIAWAVAVARGGRRSQA
ncbi:MAG: hypothetical protein R2754_16520 [Microthrixaceae bacterium]